MYGLRVGQPTHAFSDIWNLGEGGLLSHVLLHRNQGRLIDLRLVHMDGCVEKESDGCC